MIRFLITFEDLIHFESEKKGINLNLQLPGVKTKYNFLPYEIGARETDKTIFLNIKKCILGERIAKDTSL